MVARRQRLAAATTEAETRAAQQALKLVDGQHGGRRVVDRGGERLDRDIDEDAKCEQRADMAGAYSVA